MVRHMSSTHNPGALHSLAAPWVVVGLLAVVIIGAASAGERPQLSNPQYLRDHAETRAFMLGRPGKVIPTPDGKAVLFVRAQARVPKLELYEFDVATGRTRVLLTPEQVLQ